MDYDQWSNDADFHLYDSRDVATHCPSTQISDAPASSFRRSRRAQEPTPPHPQPVHPSLRHPARRLASASPPSLARLAVRALLAVDRGARCIIDWNAEFQAIIELPQTSSRDRLARACQMHKLNQQFIAAAKVCGSLIIDAEIFGEGSLDDLGGTVQRVEGGVAGGDKYSTHNMFFKLSRDRKGIYGGASYAGKACSHELKSINALLAARVPGLHLPLFALIDYRGCRMVAQSWMPIDGDTLSFGSADSGRHLHTDTDERVNAKIFTAAEGLNLKPHFVLERSTSVMKLVVGAADIEGHVGTDGRIYACDLARLFPPQAPGAVATQFFPADGRVPMTSCRWVNWRQEVVRKLSPEPGVPLHRVWVPAGLLIFTGRGRMNHRAMTFLTGQGDQEQFLVQIPGRAAAQGAQTQGAQTQGGQKGSSSRDLRVRTGMTAEKGGVAEEEEEEEGEDIEVDVRGDALLVRGSGSHLYNLLRPELVRNYPARLSSDSFSGFGGSTVCCADLACPHASRSHSDAVRGATEYLLRRVIPDFAAQLNRRELSPIDGAQLVEDMKAAGINCRFLGYLRRLVEPVHIRAMILTEMLSSLAKSILRERMRCCRGAVGEAGGQWDDGGMGGGMGGIGGGGGGGVGGDGGGGGGGNSSALQVVLKSFFNVMFGDSAVSDLFWRARLWERLREK